MNAKDAAWRQRIVALDKAHVWHPYTAMSVYLEEVDPLVVVRAEGCRLFDADGRAYLDGNASWWTASLGHRHPRIVAALERQLASLDHCAFAGATHEPAAELAAKLCAVAPGGPDGGLSRVFYTDNGSTAIEAAVKMAVQYWFHEGGSADSPASAARRKTRFVALDGAFHGESVGATSLGGVEIFRRPFAGVLFECVHAPFPEGNAYAAAFEALDALLAREHDTIAAVVVEPILQGAAGMRVYDAAYLRALREACTRHDVLLIADEVFTGYGRTGPMWACDHAGIAPDLMCVGKAFSQVLPMGATLVSDRIFESFLRGGRDRAFYYGHTFCGNPLGAAVAREVLAIYEDEHVLDRAARGATRIAAAMDRIGKLPGVLRTRRIGMVGAADLGDGAASESLEESGYLGRIGWRVYREALARGAYVRPLGDTVYLCPPLVISEADLDELLSIFEESIAAALTGRPRSP